MSKRTFRRLALVWAAVMIAVISSTLTLLLTGRAPISGRTLRVSEEEYGLIQRYSRLDEVRREIEDDYFVEVDEDALVLGAIRGMTSSLGDPYTFYYTPEELTRSNENNAGKYRGIGVLLQNTVDGGIEVVRVYPDTPAEEAGLRSGDRIVAIDGEAASGEDGRAYNAAVNHIRGMEGSSVTLTLERDGSRLDVTVRRDDVQVSYADYCMLEGGIGYIAISQFTGDAADVFLRALDDFRQQNAVGLIVDVRNNPGGLLDQAVTIADALLPTGTIVYIQERDGKRYDYYSDEDMYDVPLVILVNDMSASASEVLSSAVQAFGRGTILGVNTYGKGIVQTLIPFKEDGAGIQLTTAVYYDANDRSPQGVGVKPDIEVALVGDAVPIVPDPESDNQLAAAIDEIDRLREEQP